MSTRRACGLVVLFLFAPIVAGADDPPVKSETEASAKAEADAAADAPSEPLKAPPGFRTKKRGDLVLYCRREAVPGSRFSAEKCYDEAGLRQMRLAELEQKEMLERIKACGPGICAANRVIAL